MLRPPFSLMLWLGLTVIALASGEAPGEVSAAPRARKPASSLIFPEAACIYLGFLEGWSGEDVELRCKVPSNVTHEVDALEQLIGLQRDPRSYRWGAAPEGIWESQHSTLKGRKRSSLDPYQMTHRRSAVSEAEKGARYRFQGTVLYEDPEWLACERCTLTPACASRNAEWARSKGRSAFQVEQDRERLRQTCANLARTIHQYQQDVLAQRVDYSPIAADFSVCRKTIAPASLPLCISSLGGESSRGELHLHPSCFSDVSNSTEWALKRERFHVLWSGARGLIDSCPLSAAKSSGASRESGPDSGKAVLKAFRPRTDWDDFVTLTCFDGPGDVTDGQRGLIQFDEGLVRTMRPRAYEFTEETRRTETSGWLFKETNEIVERRQVATIDPAVIAEKKARIPLHVASDVSIQPTEAEGRAISELALLLLQDALQNQPERFRAKRPEIVNAAVAREGGLIWLMDCATRMPGRSRFRPLIEKLPGASRVLEDCRSGVVPGLPDPRQVRALQLACGRITAPPPASSPSPDPEESPFE